MPLQKSYSEWAGPYRNRSPWQRSHSHPTNLQTPNGKTLQPVSEASKNKLSKFQYQPCQAGGAIAEDTSSKAAPEGLSAPDQANGGKGDCFTTPAAKLSWKDLIDPNTPVEKETYVSPSERLEWAAGSARRTKPSPLIAYQGTKRARSSSPIPMSSPKPAVNVTKLAEALRSPHADPTLELWDRYSLRPDAVATSNNIANPSLAHLMESSSPRPMKDGLVSTGLARSASCGLNWPKRRKIERPKTSTQTHAGGLRELEAASKSSLVSALLDNLTSSMQEKKSGSDECVEDLMGSPSIQKRRLSPRKPKSPGKIKSHSSPTASNYGDDDEFDEDDLMELEANVMATQAPADDLDVGLSDVQEVPAADKAAGRQNAADLKQAQAKSTQDLEDDFDDDDFAGDIDLDAVEFAATQSAQQMSKSTPVQSSQKPRIIQRYLVTNVLESEYVDQYNNIRKEKILLIQPDGSKQVRSVALRGAWYDTPAHADAFVHIIGQFSLKGQCIVDDTHNLLILHPDHLISATVVGDSFGCMRRAVLQDRVKATSEPSPPLVYGTMLHEIFQEALMANNFDMAFLAKLIDENCEKHTEDLYVIKIGLASAKEHLLSKMTELSCWAKAFVASQPNADATVQDRGGGTTTMAVSKLLDVEEHVWSPMYGLKGNIDATTEIKIRDGAQVRTLTVPFEVKTGRSANPSHKAQTALYTLLMSDRYDIDIVCGILYYMETSQTMRIPAVRQELIHMIIQRNQLASYVRERSVQLPPMEKSKYMCGRCYAKTTCFTYHRLADEGNGETSGLGEMFEDIVKHLTQRHQEFFIKWENLLTKEEKESQKTKRELWTMTSKEREKKSRCFSEVIIEEGSARTDTNNPGINRYHYSFVKRTLPAGFSFLESELNVGEPIVVSDEQGHFALAIGYVTSVRKQRISVAVDRRLHNARIRQPGFDQENNQVFASIMEVAPEGCTPAQSEGKIREEPVLYRLDQDEFSNGMATVRNNLVQLMNREALNSNRLRELIVDRQPPRFKHVPTQYTLGDVENLNVDQTRAIEKVMSAQDYALVLGMPGTGKTTTIAHIIRALISQGKSVLLTSHTHTAVDNILLKLRDDEIRILRLGAPAKVHPEVQDFATLAGRPMKTFDEIKDAWHNTPIVATTCLGINHPIFLERSFDYCIVDEASQITLPICAGPIRMARTFVLVGDHNQLPPVVRNEEAREGGLDVSLFKLLSDCHPESVVNLAHQYRMCEDIMTLSNTLIYDGQLVCGTESLKLRKLDVPKMSSLKQVHYDSSSLMQPGTPRSFCTGPTPNTCWLFDLLASDARARFINTDTLLPEIREEAQGKRIVNSGEVQVVSQLVDSLLAVGVPQNEIGVMTHYRAQLFLLKDRLKHHAGVEMHTTDRFQGRDKEVIVLSLVRSNAACNIGDLLKDWRRINVAFTRAKTKLLVVGSMNTLKGSGRENMLSRFIALMEERDWIYHLPSNALESHHFPEFGTQLATQSSKTIKTPKKAPKPTRVPGKENVRPSPKRATIGEKALLKGRLITRDILNEMTNGAYERE